MRPDHMMHMLVGAAITALAVFAAALLDQHAPGAWGLLAAAIAGLAKEARDSLANGTVQGSDAMWTVAGGVPIAALWTLLG
ncbi:MAG: putative periplasmic lipoprotein (DUF2279) [Rhodobacteraceae bacterium HLUCCA12]|nr:MAG: putative periplasmic lipoprotein (DUF2279) [Rhodobacteraceae bacterium HLUCCA12]